MSQTIVKTLMDAVTTNTSSDWLEIPVPIDRAEILVQIDIDATITVTVEGRVKAAAKTLTAISARTASELIAIAWCPQLRVTTTGVSGGTASVFVAIPG